MDKGFYLAELLPGIKFTEAVFAVSGVREERRGTCHVLSVTLRDGSCLEGRQAADWYYSPEKHAKLCGARFIKASGSVSSHEKYVGQIGLDAWEAVPVPANTRPFLSPLPASHQEHRSRLDTLVDSVQEPHLRQLLAGVFPNSKTREMFCQAVAAQFLHHAYRGGLLEHSIEVAELCDSACRVLPSLKRDFLVTCALLHDIGKLEEMRHGVGAGEYTESGTLVGHVFAGAYRLRTVADTISGFPDTLKDAIVHLILSHHGRPEYGAARLPARAEAFVLAECDLMSARIHQCVNAAASAVEGQFSVRLPGREGEYLHIGDLGLPEIRAAKTEPIVPPVKFKTVAPKETVTEFKTTVCLPVRGRVAAGFPGVSAEEDEETREVMMPQGGADYLLHVTGDSMIGAGILEGDLLFVHAQQSAQNGEIVVAHLSEGGEVVKRLRRAPETRNIWLDSDNPQREYPPILLDDESCIQGKIVGLLRDF